jgi:D-alanine transaminase
MPLPVLVSRNGELIPPAQAAVSVFNPALYGAYGVYESMQIARGKPFALTAHLQRLAHSAGLLELPLPADLAAFENWIAALLAANQAEECTLRIFAIGPENGGAATAYLWPQPDPVYPATCYTVGASAITYEGRRFLPEAKSLNNLVALLSRRRALALGAHEALLHHSGYLTEGSNSNLFAVLDGAVITPPAGQVLPGVTRDILLKLAARHGIEIRQASLALADRLAWRECFITSTSRHVMPITVVDGQSVGDGQIGPLTRRLMELFEEYFAQEVGRVACRSSSVPVE